jgi:uncharacterized membrane protein
MLDGIVLHELLHLHSMLSSRVPPVTVEAMRLNMFADGLFHLAMWIATVVAVVWLVAVLRRPGARCGGVGLFGAALAGWGAFNLIEGVVNHHWLGLHHVVEAAADPLPADLLFLAFGGALLVTGALLVQRAPWPPVGHPAGAPPPRGRSPGA